MNCPICNKPNRPSARFCKWCGKPMAANGDNQQTSADNQQTSADSPQTSADSPQTSADSPQTSADNPQASTDSQHGKQCADNAVPYFAGFDNLIGKDEVKQCLIDVVGKAKSMDTRCKRLNLNQRMNLSFVITGDPGTGKLTVAKAITEELFKARLTSSPEPKVITPVDYKDFVKDIDRQEGALGNSVIVIQDAHKLVSDGVSKKVEEIDSLLKYVRRWREDPTKPIVVLTGLGFLKNFFDKNPATAADLDYFYHLHTLTTDNLLDIATNILFNKYRLQLSLEATEKLRRIFINDKRNPADDLRPQGHNAAARAYAIDLKVCQQNMAAGLVGPEFVEGTEFIPKTYGEVMAEFDRYVGIDEVKKTVSDLARYVEEQRLAKGSGEPIALTDHFQFLGNPGTGKTTMARLFAEALSALGVLSTGQLVEVSRRDLVSKYVGETAKLVSGKFEEAMGGVLFIDEAYSLKNSDSDTFGQEAVNEIITCSENLRGKVVVILAGYTKEMGEFMQANSGLASRFNKVVNFPDYTGPQLADIFRSMVSHSEEGYTLSDEAEAQLGNFFDRMYQSRTRNFGNARDVRTAYNNAVKALTARISMEREAGTLKPGTEKTITWADIDGDGARNIKSVDDVLASLDDIIGMDSVKEQLLSIAKKVRNDRRRAELGLGNASLPNLHIAITGNPGTGKTMVAKRLGQVLKAMGVLPKGHVVERERKSLLDSYANSAAANMDKAVDEAIGGILFIDEAYNLIPTDTPGAKDRDGTAAVEALMTRMSNDAGKFVTVIAGYKTEIDEFIANANPGLARRFTHRIHIPDYSANDLIAIYRQQADKAGFRLTPEAETLLEKKVEEMVTTKTKNFGNAGTIIKLFSESLERQSNRLPYDATEEQLVTIEPEDIPYSAPKKIDIKECMRELDRLVGLKAVKDAVHELADTLEIERMRATADGKRPEINLDHYLFLGNPGTGKTTVARIMGNIFYSLGLLPSNKVVEVTAKDLIAPYVGQTGPKTEQQIDRALGGIFFIDEAYSLNDGQGGFGKDAMPVLLTKLLDYKNRMVSIAAGYPREMHTWMNTNSGLQSRYTRTIFFEDYTGDELAQIFRSKVSANGLTMTPEADNEMQKYFNTLVFNKGANFANAREANNYFDRVKLNQGRRLRRVVALPGFNRDDLKVLVADDMIVE